MEDEVLVKREEGGPQREQQYITLARPWAGCAALGDSAHSLVGFSAPRVSTSVQDQVAGIRRRDQHQQASGIRQRLAGWLAGNGCTSGGRSLVMRGKDMALPWGVASYLGGLCRDLHMLKGNRQIASAAAQRWELKVAYGQCTAPLGSYRYLPSQLGSPLPSPALALPSNVVLCPAEGQPIDRSAT
ncbi:hypothetical protein SCAR479_01829 [Seiridium cardinale]|uniref:Uncharacterized protein n=1 Tax=Seiridium cardinale TaxID=138064 RepID=A0ABR2Y6P6_9PEZI